MFPSDANKLVFRSSGSGYLMKEPKEKTELLATETKTHLVDIYASYRYGRREEINSKFLKKGNACEEDSITLFSRNTKILFKKNDKRLTNDFITGEPDMFIGSSIEKATEIFDTKTSWSLHTFLRAKQAKLNSNYYWQGQSYMWLTGAKKHTVVYCLVNGLSSSIMDEKIKLSFQPDMLDIAGNESEEFIKQCKQIEINHIFDIELFCKHNPGFEFHNDPNEWQWDIPMEDRTHTFVVQRNEGDIIRLQNRIRLCRNWMNRELFKIN